MALTISKKLPNAIPDTVGAYLQVQVADITFDSTYDAGGEALTAANLGFPSSATIVFFRAEPASGYEFEYDRANAKLKVRTPGVAIGAAGAVTIDDFPLSGVGATATSIGLSSSATSPVLFGPQQEVAASVNLSTITTRVFAVAALGA